MKILSASDGLSVIRKCEHCKAKLRLYAGDIKVQTFMANPSEASFKCGACGKHNNLPCSRHAQKGADVIEELKRS